MTWYDRRTSAGMISNAGIAFGFIKHGKLHFPHWMPMFDYLRENDS